MTREGRSKGGRSPQGIPGDHHYKGTTGDTRSGTGPCRDDCIQILDSRDTKGGKNCGFPGWREGGMRKKRRKRGGPTLEGESFPTCSAPPHALKKRKGFFQLERGKSDRTTQRGGKREDRGSNRPNGKERGGGGDRWESFAQRGKGGR